MISKVNVWAEDVSMLRIQRTKAQSLVTVPLIAVGRRIKVPSGYSSTLLGYLGPGAYRIVRNLHTMAVFPPQLCPNDIRGFQ